jgi:Rod binding domain-containing protein
MMISDAAPLGATPTPPAVAPRLTGNRGDPAAVRKSAEDFTAFFFTQSLETVYSGISTDKMFGGGTGEDMYKSMLIQEYGKVEARACGAGIADAVQREMIKMQEKA